MLKEIIRGVRLTPAQEEMASVLEPTVTKYPYTAACLIIHQRDTIERAQAIIADRCPTAACRYCMSALVDGICGSCGL